MMDAELQRMDVAALQWVPVPALIVSSPSSVRYPGAHIALPAAPAWRSAASRSSPSVPQDTTKGAPLWGTQRPAQAGEGVIKVTNN